MEKHTPLPAILDPTPDMLDAFQSGFIEQLHRRYQLRHSPKLVGAESAEQGGLRAMLSAMPADRARLIAAAPDLLAALNTLFDRYTELVNCGDCGNWNPETEAEVTAARGAIAKATQP